MKKLIKKSEIKGLEMTEELQYIIDCINTGDTDMQVYYFGDGHGLRPYNRDGQRIIYRMIANYIERTGTRRLSEVISYLQDKFYFRPGWERYIKSLYYAGFPNVTVYTQCGQDYISID